MARYTRKHKKRGRRKTRRKGRRRRRQRRRRRRQRGGSEAYDELRKEMVAESSYQNKFTRRGMQGFLPPSAGQIATFAPNNCPNAIYRKAVYSQPGPTCWMWSAVLLLLNLSSPPISLPLNTLVKTYLVHLEYLLKTTLRRGNLCPLIPNWLKALMDWDFRTGAAAATAKGDTAWSLSGGHSASFLRSLLTASGYAVQGVTKSVSKSGGLVKEILRLKRGGRREWKTVFEGNILSYKPALYATTVGQKGGWLEGSHPPILLLTITRYDLVSHPSDHGLQVPRKNRQEKVMRDRKTKIDDRVMGCMSRGLEEEACELTEQAKAWEDDILWKWLFSDNAENVLGGIITLMWRAGDGTVANHAVSFYRCQKEGDVHIYVCNTWGEPCTKNKIKPKEFIVQFITLHKIKNLLIDRLICIVAEKTPVVRSELTSEERRINALGERVRQESLEENE